MYRKIHSMLLVILFTAGFNLYAQTGVTNTVTFYADLSKMLTDGFNPETDSIRIQGLVWDDGSTTYLGNPIFSPDENDPTLYKTTLEIYSGTVLGVGDSLRWKFFTWPDSRINGGSWESGFGDYDGYPYVLREDGAVVDLEPETPNFEYIVYGLGAQNTFHIMADVTDFVGTGVGYFDPTIDQLRVEGFVWEGMANVVSGDRVMQQNPLLPGFILETTLVLELDTAYSVGDSLRWKFNAVPDERWGNSGWELGVGYYTIFQEDGANLEIGPIVPLIAPVLGPLEEDAHVLFQVDMNNNATNRYDSTLIPLDLVEFVSVRGSHSVLGSWSGNWTEADTVDPGVPALYDNGTNGDKVAGDNIWSKIVTFPVGVQAGGFTYKYGCYYPGMESINASYYMDAFGGEGQDLFFNLPKTTELLEILDIWTDHRTITSVKLDDGNIPDKYVLEQNYPNPFNPTTSIKYTIPEASDVTLNVFNILGEKVMELVNSHQTVGTYKVDFNASSLASGIYIYSLSAGKSLMTKKLILMK
jgi:Secretion system C-terminal sorting domain